MTKYHKIQTVFMRDPSTNNKTLLMGQFAVPEFAYLANNEWVFTEKVDGTNIRVMIGPDGIRMGGRSDNSSVPEFLIERLNERFLTQSDRLREFFPNGACLYGEGYGARIQKGGGNYRPDADFVLFDVNVGNFWLQRGVVEEIATTLGIDVVPVIGRGSLAEMIDIARQGFPSTWGNFTAEGIVARPAVDLLTRSGERVITKIKHKDFAQTIAPQPDRAGSPTPRRASA